MKKLVIATVFIGSLSIASLNVFAQSESRDGLVNEIKAKRVELAALENRLLEPSAEDRAGHAEFLRQPDTGLIRLLPRDVYDQVYHPGNGLAMIGGGAYYSFTRLTHEYGYGDDIELDHNFLSVGFAGVDYGMLTILGDMPLEQITLESPSVQFISAYTPATNEAEARLEQTKFRNGLVSNDVLYKQRLPLQANSTYLLRSINYSSSGSDILVAFRVARKDTDGSVIIVWKLLKKNPKPELARTN